MALTRSAAETDIVNSLGADLLQRCGMAATMTGANADLNGPLYRALDVFRYAVADPSNVTDADLVQVPPARQVRFLDYARIMTIDVAKVRLVGAPRRQEWPTYKAEYEDTVRQLTALRDALWVEYRRATQGGPAVGKMCRESANALDLTPYFPPFPPLGNNPLWPTPPDV